MRWVNRRLFRIEEKLDGLITAFTALEKNLMAILDDLTAQVAANTSIEASAVTLIKGLADKIAAAGTDPVKLGELQVQLKASADALSAAVMANIPPAPPPPAPQPVAPPPPAAPVVEDPHQ